MKKSADAPASAEEMQPGTKGETTPYARYRGRMRDRKADFLDALEKMANEGPTTPEQRAALTMLLDGADLLFDLLIDIANPHKPSAS